MKPGQKVTIYQDPLTRLTPEGDAILVKSHGAKGKYEGMDIELWEVEFITDKALCPRRILVTEDMTLGAAR